MIQNIRKGKLKYGTFANLFKKAQMIDLTLDGLALEPMLLITVS